MLTRPQLLKASGYSDPRFQSMKRRVNERHGSDTRCYIDDLWTNRRANYAFRDALYLRLIDAFLFQSGSNVQESIASASTLLAIAEYSKVADKSLEYWGAVSHFAPSGRGHFCGDLSAITESLLPTDRFDTAPLLRVDLLNISEAARHVEKEVAAMGIEVDWSITIG